MYKLGGILVVSAPLFYEMFEQYFKLYSTLINRYNFILFDMFTFT